jgi:hypothetical protein
MAIPSQLNHQFDPQTPYIFWGEFTEDDPNETPLDVSDWSFNFKLINSAGTTVWDILNAGFTRPSTGIITFEKTQAQVYALPEGLYTIQLLVTKTGVVNDVYVEGYFGR